MRWNSPRLLSSLKIVKKSKTTEQLKIEKHSDTSQREKCHQDTQISETTEQCAAQKPSDTSRREELHQDTQISETAEQCATEKRQHTRQREKWHQDVRGADDLLETLDMEHGTGRVELLEKATANYLSTLEINSDRPSAEFDEVLDGLIEEHIKEGNSTRDIAILACFHAFTTSAAVERLISLADSDIERYLRCVSRAGLAYSGIVSSHDLQSTLLLLQILGGGGAELQTFRQLIEFLASDELPTRLVPLGIIRRILEISRIGSRLQEQLTAHLRHHRFMTVFTLVSCIPDIHKVNSDTIISLLDMYVPVLHALVDWKPNMDRIPRWEHGNFTRAQRKKISSIFDLDGPDIATGKQPSLKVTEPWCYNHVRVHPQSIEALESLLDGLYQAHMLGPGAVDVFIHLCIDNIANETALSKLEEALLMQDDSYCSDMVLIQRALNPQSDLARQMRALIEAFKFLEMKSSASIWLSSQCLEAHVLEVISAAQIEFHAQLDKGLGDYIGMLIYDLGTAILLAPWIHASLPSELLNQFRRFPPQEVLEAIFDQLQDLGGVSPSATTRFVSYLRSLLGGKSDGGAASITPALIEAEADFWRRPPDTTRRDLAKTLSKIANMEYSVYTSCLKVMMKEDDLLIRDIRYMISLEDEEVVPRFANYLAHRRGLNQLQNDCWILLLVSLFAEQAPSFLPRLAESMSFDDWQKFLKPLISLIAPIRLKLPPSGSGFTQERLLWWEKLFQNQGAVQYLLQRHTPGTLTWLYFPFSQECILVLLDIAKQGNNMSSIDHFISSCLGIDGENASDVCETILAARQTSLIGRAVCEQIFKRNGMSGGDNWSMSALNTVFEIWSRSILLTKEDKAALGLMKRLLRSTRLLQPAAVISGNVRMRLQSEYQTLLHRARNLESLRLRLRNQKPQLISALLRRLEVDNTSNSNAFDTEIPNELLDAVELIGDRHYELSFALTGLNDLQRQARGICKESRMLLVQIIWRSKPHFCIHISPNDDGHESKHSYWRASNGHEPDSTICSTSPTLFTYYLGRHLHQLLLSNMTSLRSVHSLILRLINGSPSTCLVCCTPLNVKLWKPATCSRNCSIRLRRAPLTIRLHNIVVDPLAIDLLLTCVYAAADPTADGLNLNLLPGCPVDRNSLRTVIDSFPSLASLHTAPNLATALRGSDGYGTSREKLLSWLCLKFRGFMMTTPDGYRVPSMPGTQQFLVLNSIPEREKAFKARAASPSNSRAVFHGTKATRLLLILTKGLKSMSATQYMIHGRYGGNGVFCAEDQSTSVPYAGNTGQSWRHSALSNMRIMLGCELAACASPAGVHIVPDDERIIVRYVFLLPPNYSPPPRRHVEPAMNTAFASLTSGLVI